MAYWIYLEFQTI